MSTQTTENTKIGLLTTYDYINASLAPLCSSVASKECKNYNYSPIKYFLASNVGCSIPFLTNLLLRAARVSNSFSYKHCCL